MSHLDSVRTERWLSEERNEMPLRRLGLFAVIAVLLLAVAVGLTEVHLLPSFSADDFVSLLFGAG